MKSIISIILISSLLLSSCGSAITTTVWSTKTDFFVKTLKLSSTTGSYTVEKSARLTAASSLSISSDGIGQIDSILVKEGQSVKKWQVIVKLKDSAAMYGIQVQQASNGITSANASREATLANLDQALTNAEIAQAQAQRTLDTLLKDSKERRKQAQNDYFNANPNNTGSTAQINIEKLKIDLASAENNYNNQILTLDANYHLYANDFEKLSSSMLFEWDRILGITSTYQYSNDNWEPYLGLYIGSAKVDADNKWGELYAARGEIRAKQDTKITTLNIQTEIDKLSSYYQTARDMWTSMSTMLENSMVGAGLSQDILNGWIAQWTGFRATEQASESQFTAWKNGAISIIPTAGGKSVAEMNIDSLNLQISGAERAIQIGNDSATIWYNRTIISLDDQIQAAQLSLEQAQKNFAAAKKNRDATAKQLGASVNSASTSLTLAKANYDKLSIKAPVNGKVTKITVSVGQTINSGTPIGEMASSMPEMTIDTEADIALNLVAWDSVQVKVGDSTLTGTVSAISHIANSNLLYTTRISVSSGKNLIWQAAKIIFTISNSKDTLTGISLPLLDINIISENEWEIFLLTRSGSELIPKRKSVTLWSLHGDSIEILEEFPTNTEIIMSDVSNFDSSKQQLVVQNNNVQKVSQ